MRKSGQKSAYPKGPIHEKILPCEARFRTQEWISASGCPYRIPSVKPLPVTTNSVDSRAASAGILQHPTPIISGLKLKIQIGGV